MGCKGPPKATACGQGADQPVKSSSVELAEARFFDAVSDPVDADLPALAPREPVPRAEAGVPSQFLAAVKIWKGRIRAGGLSIAAMAASELARGTPFNFIPIFIATGALGYFSAQTEPSLYLLLAVCGVAAVAIFALRGRVAWQLGAWAVLSIVLGALAAKLETMRADTKMLGGEITTRLTGRIVATDHMANGRVRLTLDVVATARPELRYAPDRVRITARSIPAETRAGDEVIGAARLLPPLGATRPGSFDFAFKSYFDGVGATGFFLGPPKIVQVPGDPGFMDRFNAAVENARDRLAARIRSHIGGAEGEIAAALIAGVRAGIPEEVNEALRRTGLAHVLSISGLHMALVAATIIGALRLLFACFQGFATRYPVRKYAAAAALVALAIYLFISGNEVAARRSFIMIAIMLVALLFDRAALTMRNLAISAIIVLVISPHEVVGPSFQMSFAATAALIGAYGGWSQRGARPIGAAPGSRHLVVRGGRLVLLYVAGLAATSVLAGVATSVFGAHHFQRVSPLSLFANLAAMPIVSVLVMPFAVLGLVLMPIGLDGIAFAVMGEGLRLMNLVADWFSRLSPVDAVGLIAPGAVICLTLALVFATLLTTWLRLIAVAFTLAGIVFLTFPPRPEIFISDDARLVAFHTSAGDTAVNRSRPNAFTLNGWKYAFVSENVIKPLSADDETTRRGKKVSSPPVDGATDERFRCTPTDCTAVTRLGTIVVTSQVETARNACGTARLIVLDDATAEFACQGTQTRIVTRRDLARRGSVVIDEMDQIGFAINEPYRPWHDQRRFSREARGLAPWQPRRSTPRDTPAIEGATAAPDQISK